MSLQVSEFDEVYFLRAFSSVELIGGIVEVCPNVEMGRVLTGRVIAGVSNNKTRGYWSFDLLIDVAVRPKGFGTAATAAATNFDAAVPPS